MVFILAPGETGREGIMLNTNDDSDANLRKWSMEQRRERSTLGVRRPIVKLS